MIQAWWHALDTNFGGPGKLGATPPFWLVGVNKSNWMGASATKELEGVGAGVLGTAPVLDMLWRGKKYTQKNITKWQSKNTKIIHGWMNLRVWFLYIKRKYCSLNCLVLIKIILRNNSVSNLIKIKKIHALSKLFDTYIKCFDRTSPKKVYII